MLGNNESIERMGRCECSNDNEFQFSPALKRAVSAITDIAMVRIDLGVAGPLSLTTVAEKSSPGERTRRRHAMVVSEGPGALVSIEPAESFKGIEALTKAIDIPGRWRVITCRFENGFQDQIAIRLKGGDHDRYCNEVIRAIWPTLREDCILEAFNGKDEPAFEALTWTAAKKTDEAILIMRRSAELLEANDSAREVLSQGDLLRVRRGRLVTAVATLDGELYEALEACAEGSGDGAQLLFLTSRNDGSQVPIALSRFQRAEGSEPLVVAIMPRRPDRERIEMLAQKMGLTPVEARVAALMQLGLSNREAARIAGLKEQTFNTYAKRVLSKLNVGCRAEMAQMLTWQAALGRVS